MKTIILCGGRGSRMKEETEFRPKPLVTVGDKPILWHIMKIYAHHGFNDFILALGYKGHMIKEYFLNRRIIAGDFSLNTKTDEKTFHDEPPEDFKITFAETGLDSNTSDRVLLSKKYLGDDDFMVTFGDGVSDIDLKALVDFHKKQGTVGTVTGVHLKSKYGVMKFDPEKKKVTRFDQKPLMSDHVAGGFMIFKKKALDYFRPGEILEIGLGRMVEEGQLSLYQHEGFWRAMDTYQEVEELNDLWRKNQPWAIWKKSS